jgi:hypothetical protein
MECPPSDALAGADEPAGQGEEGKRGNDEHDVEHRCSPVEISDGRNPTPTRHQGSKRESIKES